MKGDFQRFARGCAPSRKTGHEDRDMGYTTPCWMPRGGRTWYSHVYVDGKPVLGHRAEYEKRHGPIPEGLVLDHLCRVPACRNPDHLEAVTQRENIRRGALAKLSDADREAILADSRSMRAIAADYGVAHTTILTVKGRRGSGSNAKLTAADRVAIRADPRAMRVIAADYGVGSTQIWRVKHSS